MFNWIFVFSIAIPGMGAFFLSKIQDGNIILPSNIGEAVLIEVIFSFGHVIMYYGFFRKVIDKETFPQIEHQRHGAGLGARFLYGGVVEEIIFRWGLMSLFITSISFFHDVTQIIVILGIILSSILFAITHFLGVKGMKKSRWLYSYAVLGNLWVGIFCGWQFWSNGLISAIIVHMLFHLLLYPCELWYRKKIGSDETNAVNM
ncbi:CPBP family intramembrane metalloprotease [Bacillus sp. Xin]|uniref:CPBP family intramembrane glutamic endopeptidase n=1 Tax=unclassified Bacillus (in: firmicutes) TaxID=185979 RepID=UPI001572C726|nr:MULTISPECIES: CPBP family intramembrane glutamic endopeptidase [unclassified Bacillus (in: firmicutes)]MBC6973116.1 CPBP family intramembrane metalloprotease [Bacillus sp. Xin]NSW36306.1 CPBP family intramembrane metalloprotease [Bacillus sp. Xin1]